MTTQPAGSVIYLDATDLAIACALVLVAGLVSLSLGLRLEKRLGIAAVRTVVQLLVIGYILGWVFQLQTAWAILPVLGVMILVASRAAVQRSSRAYRWARGLALVSLIISSLTATLTVTSLVIGVRPWYRPQYVIPLLGMVLGNSLTGISLCLDQLLEALDERREEVEMELALGASRWEAARGPVGQGVRRGMIPIINSMSVVGLVSLPGMMTGQILANADPMIAVRYQIVVMFMIAAGTSLGCILIALLTYRRLFNGRHQLLADRITKRSS